jgi:hypothetical protein
MNLQEKIKHYGLIAGDWFQHQHYTILTRQGIEKVQGIEKISIKYEVVKCEENFAVFKAIGSKEGVTIETYGSALKGDYKNGNCNTWYVAEMAEKRAMSRAVLKITGFYELGVFGEDESEDFKQVAQPKEETKKLDIVVPTPKRLSAAQVKSIPTSTDLSKLESSLTAFTLQPSEKELINKRIAELKK